MTTPTGRTARRAHTAATALLVLVVVPDPWRRRRREADFATLVVHQQRADAVMRRAGPLLSVAAVTTGLVATATTARHDAVGSGLRALSASAVAAAVVVTARVHLPVNAQLRTWTPDAEVDGWRRTWDAWERGHVARRALTGLAGGLVVAAAGRRPPPRQGAGSS